VCGRGEVYIWSFMGTVRERDHLEDPGIDRRIILIWVFRQWDMWPWTGSIWLRIGTDGGCLYIW